MSPRSTEGPTGKRPSKFEGVTSRYRMRGKFNGKSCKISVKTRNGMILTRVLTDGELSLKIEPVDAATVPAILPMPMPWSRNGTGATDNTQLHSYMKRTLLCDEKGDIEDALIDFLSPTEFEKVMAGPSFPIVRVKDRNDPFSRCVEYYDGEGELKRTEWSSRMSLRAA